METNTKTPTPRTDAAHKADIRLYPQSLCVTEVVDASFARQLETELTAAQAEIAELRKDKERLDWIEAGRFALTPVYGLVPPMGSGLTTPFDGYVINCDMTTEAKPLRLAIDAAMTQGKDGQ